MLGNEIETRPMLSQTLFLEMPMVQLVQSSHYGKKYNLRTHT